MELEKLTEFLNNHLESQTSSSLYISGPPGTGKTACLMNILDRQEVRIPFSLMYYISAKNFPCFFFCL